MANSSKFQSYKIPHPSSKDKELFKSIFDFHEDYRAEKLISMLDIFHQMVIMVAEDHSILFANAEAIRKMNLQDFHLHKIDEILFLSQDDSNNLSVGMNRTDTFYRFESYLLNNPDVPVCCDVCFFELTNKSKVGYWIIQDISDLKKIENTLVKTDKIYRKILVETSDAVLRLNKEFKITEINRAALSLMKIEGFQSGEISFFKFIDKDSAELFTNAANSGTKLTNHRLRLLIGEEKINPMILLNFRNISEDEGFIVFMKDVTAELNFHQLMMRTIVNTQEKERERLSMDIHDDLGQQLSALKFHLSALRSYIPNDQARELLIMSENILLETLSSVRSICFDLMPKTLEKSGLLETISELKWRMEAMNHVEIELMSDDDFPKLEDEKNVALFRIIQEFINNSIRHGKSSKIRIVLKHVKDFILMYLSDDGKGFDMTDPFRKVGNGMENIDSRVKAYNGAVNFSSKPGLGTSCEIRMPIGTNIN